MVWNFIVCVSDLTEETEKFNRSKIAKIALKNGTLAHACASKLTVQSFALASMERVSLEGIWSNRSLSLSATHSLSSYSVDPSLAMSLSSLLSRETAAKIAKQSRREIPSFIIFCKDVMSRMPLTSPSLMNNGKQQSYSLTMFSCPWADERRYLCEELPGVSLGLTDVIAAFISLTASWRFMPWSFSEIS